MGTAPKNEAEPWLARPEWAAGRIPSREGRRALGELLAAVLLLGFSVPVTWLLLGREDLPRVMAYLVAAFAALGTWMLIRALLRVAARAWFGLSALELPTVPLSTGRRHDAVLVIPRRLRFAHGLQQTVTHVEVVLRETSDGKELREVPRWQDVQRVPPGAERRDTDGTRVVVYVDPPNGHADATPARRGARSLWRLDVHARLFGLDYRARFELPVFRTESASPDEAPPRRRRAIANRELLEQARFRVRELPGGLRIVQPRLPSPGMAAALASANLFLWGGVVAAAQLGAPWLLTAFLGAFGVLLALALVDSVLGRATLELRHGELRFTAGLPLLGRRGVLSRERAADLRVTSGDRYGERLLYELETPPSEGEGRRLRVAASLPDRATAEALLAELRESLDAAA